MEIMLTDKYKLVTHDRLNMRLHELREVRKFNKPRNEGGKPTGETVTEWVPLEAFFQDVPSAVLSVYKRLQRDDPHKGDLASAIKRMERIKDELIAGVSA